MKDHYRKLGVSPTSSESQIRVALINKRSELSVEDIADIEHVLLDGFRRKKYDPVHKTVQCIVDIRNQIQINETSGKQRSNLRGFAATDQQQRSTRPAAQPKQGQSAWGVCIFYILLIGGISLGSILLNKKEKKPEIPNNYTSPGYEPSVNSRNQSHTFPPQPETEPGRLATPTTGVMQQYDYAELVAPLEIRTKPGSGNYYVKISRIVGDRLILSRTAFIRDGGTLNTTMPLGDFEIRYAVGKNWYGIERLFGKSTSYAKADDVFSFEETPQGYSGFTVELYRQFNGNLETEPLTANEF